MADTLPSPSPAADRAPGALARRLRAAIPRDEAQLRRALIWVLGTGLLIRLFLAATTAGSISDLKAFRFVHQALADDPLRFYAEANPAENRFAWPYLPGFLPLMELIFKASDATGISFDRLIRLPAIAADIAIAWVVQWHLGWRGASPAARLGAAALVAFAPVGILFTGAHGQIDPLEWLAVVLAVVAWERLPEGRRAVVAGLLVGLAIAIKPPAALAGLALFALGRGVGERLVFAVAAGAIPFIAILPFLLADPDGALSVLNYQSVPGQGGLSMILQPDLALARFAGVPVSGFNGTEQALQDVAGLLVAAAAIGVAAIGARAKAAPAELIAALILATFVVSPNFLPPYVIWLVPFAVLAGWWRFLLAAYVLTLFVLPFKYLPAKAVELLHLGPSPVYSRDIVAAVYIPAGALLWALMAWQLGRWAVRTLRASP
jgi:hypothetical protein